MGSPEKLVFCPGIFFLFANSVFLQFEVVLTDSS